MKEYVTPEALRGNLSGGWSRRIDDINRLVYRIHNNIVEIAQRKGHYKDKLKSSVINKIFKNN